MLMTIFGEGSMRSLIQQLRAPRRQHTVHVTTGLGRNTACSLIGAGFPIPESTALLCSLFSAEHDLESIPLLSASLQAEGV